MRVAWEVTPLSVPPTGIGRYILGSLEAMAGARPDWDVRAVAVADNVQPGARCHEPKKRALDARRVRHDFGSVLCLQRPHDIKLCLRSAESVSGF